VNETNMWLKQSSILLLACTAKLASASSLTSYEFMFGNSKHITHPIIDPAWIAQLPTQQDPKIHLDKVDVSLAHTSRWLLIAILPCAELGTKISVWWVSTTRTVFSLSRWTIMMHPTGVS